MKKESNPMPPKDVIKPPPPPPPPLRKYKTGLFGILILQNQYEINKWRKGSGDER
jgi:hypothetical protein